MKTINMRQGQNLQSQVYQVVRIQHKKQNNSKIPCIFISVQTISVENPSHMLKPKLNIDCSVRIQQPHLQTAKSPHKVNSTIFKPFMNTSSLFMLNQCSEKQLISSHKQPLHQSKPSNKKPLTLDDFLFESEHQTKTTDKILQRQNHQKSTKLVPTNPFEQILNESDTPDFNLSLPFVEGFSKIDLKSPTFSDIFTMSELKSPQFKNQNDHFFKTTKRKSNQLKEDLNKTVKVGDYFKKDENEESFIQKMDRCIHEMDVSKNKKSPSTARVNNLPKNLSDYKKLSAGFKLKNHFNPSTPKLSKIPSMSQTQPLKIPKHECDPKFFSVESNPEEEGQVVNPISINLVKTPKIYKFSEKNKQTERRTSFTKKQAKENNYSIKKEKKGCFEYKVTVPKKDLKEEMEEIYRGKFKLQKTMRS